VSRPARPRSTRGGAALALAASLAVAPLLAACQPAQAGAAAVVGDRRVTVEEVQTATTELRSIVQDPTQISQDLVLGWLITSPYVLQVASDQGQGVSTQDAQRFFQQANFKAVGGGSTPSDASVEAVQTAYALQKLTGQGSDQKTAQAAVDTILADLKSAGVKVNPRYGTFDYRWDAQSGTFSLSPHTSNWLQPAPGATAPAGQPAPSGTPGEGGATPSPAAS
jgi:hypothetical protein